ncbi:hypothetical protein IG547_08295, partial [Vibrio cholerae]|uniref:hypothetical protein n=1 Tax=Vibrio cholerae TaxID=666 RepID=UPI00226F5D8B
MAPRIPQKIDAEIYEMINGAINSGETISEFQFQGLIHKAKKMSVPRRYACLSAVYSYAFNFDLVIENALNSVKYGIDDPFCVDNALYALSNNLLYKEIVNISKNNPLVLRHEDSLNTVYESAIYSFDFDYCEYINNMFKVE